MGGIFACIALVNAFFLGRGQMVMLRYGNSMPLGNVLIAYLGFGPVTGVLFGLALPFMRSTWNAYMLGVLASIPFILSVIIGIEGVLPWSFKSSLLLAVMTLIFGGVGGIIVREVAQDS